MRGFGGREAALVFLSSVVDAGGCGYICALGSFRSWGGCNPGTSWGAEAALGLEGVKPWTGIVEDREEFVFWQCCLTSLVLGKSSEALHSAGCARPRIESQQGLLQSAPSLQ